MYKLMSVERFYGTAKVWKFCSFEYREAINATQITLSCEVMEEKKEFRRLGKALSEKCTLDSRMQIIF